MVVALTLISVFLFILYKCFSSRNLNFWKKGGINGLLFGNLLENFKTPCNILNVERVRKYGKIYGYLEMSQPVLTVADNEILKEMIIDDFHCFNNHNNIFAGDSFMSKSFTSLEDNHWKRVRNIVYTAFTTSKIKHMFHLLDRCVVNLVEFCKQNAESKTSIDMNITTKSFAMDAIASFAFGIKSNSFKYPENEFHKHALKLSNLRRLRTFIGLLLPTNIKKWTAFMLLNPQSVDYFKEAMKHIIREKQSTDSKHKYLVKLLLDAEFNEKYNVTDDVNINVSQSQMKLTEEEICAQCVFIILAAFESTSIALNYLLYVLAKKPDIENKVKEEVKQLFKKNQFNYDKLTSLHYLDAFINECFRMYPPAVNFERVAKYDYKLRKTGVTIPKGTLLNMPFYAIHHDPDYWPEPEKFLIERFLPENKDKIKSYTFLPFGIDPKMCLGWKLAMLQLKMAISKIVYNFELLQTENTPDEPIFNSKKFLLLCENIYISLRQRNSE